MPILEEIKQKMLEAAKAKDQVKLDALRMASSAVHYREIEKKGKLDEKEVAVVLQSLCKQRRESVEQFRKGGREDLASKEARELELLQSFLPQQASREEVEREARRIIKELGASGKGDMGKVMKALMKEQAGRVDGAIVSEVVKALLP